METTSLPLQKQENRVRGRGWALAGTALAILGPLLYYFQIRAAVLSMPWYLPVLTAGAVVLCLVAVVLRPRSIWRWLGLGLSGVLAAGAGLLVFGVSTPPYTGPLAQGRPVPEFVAARADGSPFTRQDLLGDKNTVLVFFRGHW
jgi:hypothetical protein